MRRMLAIMGVAAVLCLGGGAFWAPGASAHRDGCHSHHSCPSDTGSYVCGDTGYTSGCGGQDVGRATRDVYNCDDFATQDQAQATFAATPGDPHGLDADGDGTACEELIRDAQVPTTATISEDLYNCDDFATHDRAQATYAAEASDPHNLDGDGDGIACEELIRAAQGPTPTTVVAVTAVTSAPAIPATAAPTVAAPGPGGQAGSPAARTTLPRTGIKLEYLLATAEIVLFLSGVVFVVGDLRDKRLR